MMKILFCSLMLFSVALAADTPNSAMMCGAEPGFLQRFFTDAEKIRIKCIDEIHKQNIEKIQREMDSLRLIYNSFGKEIKQLAYKAEYSMVLCKSPHSKPDTNSKRCSELVAAQNGILDRIRELEGWSPKPVKPENQTIEGLTPPCPSKETLDKVKAVRMYNRKLYQTWERCVTLDPTAYYQ